MDPKSRVKQEKPAVVEEKPAVVEEKPAVVEENRPQPIPVKPAPVVGPVIISEQGFIAKSFDGVVRKLTVDELVELTDDEVQRVYTGFTQIVDECITGKDGNLVTRYFFYNQVDSASCMALCLGYSQAHSILTQPQNEFQTIEKKSSWLAAVVQESARLRGALQQKKVK